MTISVLKEDVKLEGILREGPASGSSSEAPLYILAVKDGDDLEQLGKWLLDSPPRGDARLLLVHVVRPRWQDELPYSGLSGQRMLTEHDERMHDMKLLLDCGKRSFLNLKPELQVETMVLEGDIVEELSAAASRYGAEAIVLSASSAGEDVWALFKSDLAKVLKKANTAEIVSLPNRAKKNTPGRKAAARV